MGSGSGEKLCLPPGPCDGPTTPVLQGVLAKSPFPRCLQGAASTGKVQAPLPVAPAGLEGPMGPLSLEPAAPGHEVPEGKDRNTQGRIVLPLEQVCTAGQSQGSAKACKGLSEAVKSLSIPPLDSSPLEASRLPASPGTAQQATGSARSKGRPRALETIAVLAKGPPGPKHTPAQHHGRVPKGQVVVLAMLPPCLPSAKAFRLGQTHLGLEYAPRRLAQGHGPLPAPPEASSHGLCTAHSAHTESLLGRPTLLPGDKGLSEQMLPPQSARQMPPPHGTRPALPCPRQAALREHRIGTSTGPRNEPPGGKHLQLVGGRAARTEQK